MRGAGQAAVGQSAAKCACGSATQQFGAAVVTSVISSLHPGTQLLSDGSVTCVLSGCPLADLCLLHLSSFTQVQSPHLGGPDDLASAKSMLSIVWTYMNHAHILSLKLVRGNKDAAAQVHSRCNVHILQIEATNQC